MSPAARFPSLVPLAVPPTLLRFEYRRMWGGMKECYLLAAGRSGSDPSSGPRRLVRTPVAVHLLPGGEGEHVFARLRALPLFAAVRE